MLVSSGCPSCGWETGVGLGPLQLGKTQQVVLRLIANHPLQLRITARRTQWYVAIR